MSASAPSTTLAIPRPMAEALLELAREELPNEACALLGGDMSSGQALSLHPTRNADGSPLRYTVHPDDLVRITFALEDVGQDLLAIFHSHTHTPAVPSPTDLRAAQYPDAFYLLASLTDPTARPEEALRAWRIRDGQSAEMGLVIT